MRAVRLIVSLAVVFSACGSSEEPAPTVPTTIAPATPADIAAAWIDAVIAGDVAELATLVEPAGLVVLAGVENAYTEAEMIALLDAGWPADLIGDYWSSFRSGFSKVAGIPLQAVTVGGHTVFPLGEVDFAGVVITSGEASTEFMTRSDADGWRLDLIASFGPAFAGQLRRLLFGLSDGPEGQRIRSVYRSAVIPGLVAALRRDSGNRVLEDELERMTLFLES